eukprot:s4180_g7.t1
MADTRHQSVHEPKCVSLQCRYVRRGRSCNLFHISPRLQQLDKRNARGGRMFTLAPPRSWGPTTHSEVELFQQKLRAERKAELNALRCQGVRG